MRWWWCLDDGVPPFRKGLSLEGLLTGECPLGLKDSFNLSEQGTRRVQEHTIVSIVAASVRGHDSVAVIQCIRINLKGSGFLYQQVELD